jgi:two-component system, OmpR family, alkaline phosphatase synthesis response regulator PhoP
MWFSTTKPTTPPPSSSKKVLIVEDDVQLAAALELKFSQAGFTVLKAVDGQAGFDTIVSQKPDILILDLKLPIMDGKALLRKLSLDYPAFKSLPVIVLTNAGSVENMAETGSFPNVKDFLIKSNVTLEEIITKAKSITDYLP